MRPSDMTDPDWRTINQANWNERVPLHVNSKLHYNQAALRNGAARLDAIVSAVLEPVAGLRVLHLQCHFGMDSLALAQQGADVTGVDFSLPAIEQATALARELGLAAKARFIVSDVYDAPTALPQPASFDRVLVSWGALCWLPDMDAWAKVIAYFLKPGGWLALAEMHPIPWVFDSRSATPDGRPGWWWPYFRRDAMIEDRTEDYADPDAVLANARTHEWIHPLSDIVTALLNAGLTMTRFTEHDSLPWQAFDCLVRHDDGFYRWPDEAWLPLSYSLRAAKLGSTSDAG